MNDFQNIKKLLLPAIKGLPIILGCLIISIFIAYRIIMYSNPMYESTAKIKLDDLSYGVSSSMLFKDFDVFSNTNKIAGEVELLKSKVLIEKALSQLDFGISYYRVGKIREKELYHDTPFLVDYDTINKNLYDHLFDLQIHSDNAYILKYHEIEIPGKFGDSILINDSKIVIHLNKELLESKPHFDLIDHYHFQINSVPYQVNTIIKSNLDILELEEDIAVIRVSLKSPVPEKTADFVNTLTETYIQDYIETRTNAASKTVNFIDDQLKIAAKKLENSESNLEKYRLNNNIINTRQETETDLRKIAQLKIQLANLEMNEEALDSLVEYINTSDKDFLELAPNFEAYNDLLSTELIKKLKFYQAEKRDLLTKYTLEDDKVKIIDDKVNDIANYLKEGIINSQKNIKTKRAQIQATISKSEEVFIGLPTKEKKMIILERDFQLNQKIFNFLTEKRTEAAISEAANIAFHRIIEKAYVPKVTVSPKKTLILIVSGFLGLLIGIIVIYVNEFIGGKIHSRDDLEKISSTPVSGIIKKQNDSFCKEESFQALATSISLLNQIKKKQSILFTSTISNEGKTYISKNLAIAFAQLGWKVVIVDLNLRNAQLHKEFNDDNELGISNVLSKEYTLNEVFKSSETENLTVISAGNNINKPLKLFSNGALENVIQDLKKTFDLVFIDSPATAIAPEAINLMKVCDHTYYIVKANFTKSQFLMNADLIAEEYGINTIKLLLNNVHKATNFNGNYTGSRFNYKYKNQDITGKIKNYIKYYLK